MGRISKPPEIRKREILETAMKLFYEKGYENTSMADIAKELSVVPGLCYRYFPSKQKLFQKAMQQYAEECCMPFIKALSDRSKSINEMMDTIRGIMANEEENNRYHKFYHKPGNEAFHEALSIKMCKYMLPHVTEALTFLCEQGSLPLENPTLTAKFIMYGQMGLLQEQEEPFAKRLEFMRSCIAKLLGNTK